MSVGNRLLETGHYASQQIQQISSQLEQEWKAFAAALDERSTLLEMSASFHQKADQVHAERLTDKQDIKFWGCLPLESWQLHAQVHTYVVELMGILSLMIGTNKRGNGAY